MVCRDVIVQIYKSVCCEMAFNHTRSASPVHKGVYTHTHICSRGHDSSSMSCFEIATQPPPLRFARARTSIYLLHIRERHTNCQRAKRRTISDRNRRRVCTSCGDNGCTNTQTHTHSLASNINACDMLAKSAYILVGLLVLFTWDAQPHIHIYIV